MRASGARYCAYTPEVTGRMGDVILCEADTPHLVRLGRAAVCTDSATVTASTLPEAVCRVFGGACSLPERSAPSIDCLFWSHLDSPCPADLVDLCPGGRVAVSSGAVVVARTEGACGGSLSVQDVGTLDDALVVTGDLSFGASPELTLDVWIALPAGAAQGGGDVLSQLDGQYGLTVADGAVVAHLGGSCDGLYFRSAAVPFPADGTWHHVSAHLDRRIDRVEVALEQGPSASSESAGPTDCPYPPSADANRGLVVGRGLLGAAFAGSIDELGVRRGDHLLDRAGRP